MTGPARADPGGPATALARRLPAGVVDSGLSSLATFAVGLAATHYLTTALLGSFALATAALALAVSVPATLVFAAVDRDNAVQETGLARLAVLPRSLRTGLVVAAGSAALASVLFVVLPTTVRLHDRLAMGLSLLVVATFAGLQDHARGVLHQSGLSWTAARVSACQLLVALGVVGGCALAKVANRAEVPLAALGAGDLISLVLAVLLARRRAHPGVSRPPISTRLVQVGPRGLWLLGGSAVQFGAAFAIVSVFTAGSGPVAAGQAEAARLVAQPVTVIVVGLLAVLGPDLTSATAQGDRERVRKALLVLFGAVLLLAVAWTALVGRDWSWSPMRSIFPPAYDQPRLIPLIILGQVGAYLALAFAPIAMAGLRTRLLAGVTTGAAVVALLAAVLLRGRGEAGVAVTGLVGAAAALGAGLAMTAVLLRDRPGLRSLTGVNRPAGNRPEAPLASDLRPPRPTPLASTTRTTTTDDKAHPPEGGDAHPRAQIG